MSTYAQQAELAVSPGFTARVRVAVIRQAAILLGQPQDTARPVSFGLITGLATAVLQDTAPYLERFSWAVATTANVADADMSLYGIASTAPGPPAVITTTAPTVLGDGGTVAIDGAADLILNGTWRITLLTPTSFSIPVAGTETGPAGGTVTDQPTDDGILAAVTVAWDGIAGVVPGMV